MEEVVTLWYGVYGDAVVFPIKINRHSHVCELLEAIFDAERYRDRFTFSPSALTLRLARKDDAWVMQDHKMNELLRGEVDSQFETMDLWRKLSDDAYFGKDFQPGDGQLHILVERPDRKKPSRGPTRPRGVRNGRPSQKFLDAIAQRLWDDYYFDFFYRDFPTMEDALRAVEGGKWSVRETYEGNPKTSTAMSDFFTQNEWEQLKKLNKITTRRTHDGNVYSTPDGKERLVLPHCLASEEAADTFKMIGEKVELWNLVVEDEDEIESR